MSGIGWLVTGIVCGFVSGALAGYSIGLDDIRVGPSAWKRLKAWLSEPW